MNELDERISFAEAIEDPKLLKPHFDTLSRPQQTALRVFYGLPLTTPVELVDWAVFQDQAEYDSLGFIKSINPPPYIAKEYSTLVGIIGRRAGKTSSIGGTIIAYEAVLGGHSKHVAKNQDFQILFIAQDIGMAQSHLKFVENALRSTPLLDKYVEGVTINGISLKNGLTIVPAPPTIKSSRGLAVPVVVMDEVGFWYTDTKAANPDFEVEIAVRYAQLTFPHRKKLIISTPWRKEGLLWKYNRVGTEGVKLRCEQCNSDRIWQCEHKKLEQKQHRNILVIHAPTAAMGNPTITKEALEGIRDEDPDAFPRESLAEFVDSISGFLPGALVGEAIDQGVTSRAKLDGPYYVAAIDPAFRGDSFAFTIVHHDSEKGMIQDRLIQWVPSQGNHLNPAMILDQVKTILDEFGLNFAYSDQYHLDSIDQLCQDRGFSLIETTFTGVSKAKILGSLEMLVKQKRIRLLDDQTQFQQLTQLEKRKTPTGTIQIAAPNGKHDDAAMVLALAVFQATWLLSSTIGTPRDRIPSHVEKGMAQIERQRREMMIGEED